MMIELKTLFNESDTCYEIRHDSPYWVHFNIIGVIFTRKKIQINKIIFWFDEYKVE